MSAPSVAGSSPLRRHRVFYAGCLGAAVFCCLVLWAFGSLSDNSLHHAFHGKPLPWITETCLRWRVVILLFPLPWFVVAWVRGLRKHATAEQMVVFTATLALSLLCLTVFLAFVYTLPWLPICLC